jgi:hypothetical protein
MMKARIAIIAGCVLLALGALSLAETEASAIALIVPAVPLYLISSAFDPAARSGLLWDSAHSPPFLNGAGIACVYFIPGAVLLLFGAVSRQRSRSA